MKRILVPTDFSEQADNALKVAVKLAKTYNSEIFVLHSMNVPLQLATSSDSGSLPESLFFIKLAEKNFGELRVKEFLDGIVINETIGRNEIYEDIKDNCEEFNIDLIVMGSNGASGFKEMFVGSNAEKVVRTSDIPVLVIKNEHANFDVDNFVFASDFKDDNKETYRQAVDFATAFDAKIHLLMVNTPNNFSNTTNAEKRIQEFIQDYPFANYTMNVYNDESVEKGILNFSREIDADLIGISTHGRQGIAHFFNGSISEDLVNHANRPVITFKI